ncbi:MAG: hypothetical protein JWP27_2423, partial [Flaviaesturariibacter sp.]|nr:hypothetical protein [Flaviaesturariibacter sp.]
MARNEAISCTFMLYGIARNE